MQLKTLEYKAQRIACTLRFCPSNGKDPLTSVYRITPRLHTSTSGPSYFLPEHGMHTVTANIMVT